MVDVQIDGVRLGPARTINFTGVSGSQDGSVATVGVTAGGGAPTGPAGGVLGGSYPDPTFADDMASQTELNDHAAATTSVHGIADTVDLVTDADPRLSDARTPTGHHTSHEPGGGDVLVGFERTSNKGAVSGYASLDGAGKVPTSQLPALAITNTQTAASQAAMLALSAETGDVAVRSDLNKSFILAGTDPTILAHWQELLTPTDTVTSVNGETGAVSLIAAEIPYSGSTGLSSTNVEAALDELDGEKQALSEKGAASGYASLDGSTKVPIAQVPTGTTGSTVPFGNDARFSDARTPLAHDIDGAAHNGFPGGTATFLRADGTFAAPSASVAISEVSIPFTDGDTLRHVTVTDAGVSAASKIVGSIRRPDTADDSADPGYLYIPNVVRVASGAFDLLVACLGWGFDDPVERPPNETIKFQYTIA